MLDSLQDEFQFALNQELGPCDTWTSVILYPKLARIVALLSGRVFVGRPLSRNENWLASSIQYTIDCDGARRAVLKYPSLLRRFIVPFLPEIRRLNYHKYLGAKLLDTLLQDCIEKHGKEKTITEKHQDQQGVFFSWVLNHVEDLSTINPLQMATWQMACELLQTSPFTGTLMFT